MLRRDDRAGAARGTPAATCSARLASAGAGLLVATLDGIERGELVAQPQPADGVSYAPKLTVEDARVDWSLPAFHVDRQVRACTPGPGCLDHLRSASGWASGPVEPAGPTDLEPGPARRSGAARCWSAPATGRRCGSARCAPPAGRPMAADAWARGRARPRRRDGRHVSRPAHRPAAAARRAAPPRRGKPQPDAPRRVAFDLLRAVDERDAYANLTLPGLLRERGLTGRDAAFATELAYGTLRGRGTYDAVLAACVDRPLDQVDPPVLDVLRLGAHQLLAMRVPSHAAVGATVELARAVVGEGRGSFVNAVLRRVGGRDLAAWLAQVAPPLRRRPARPPRRRPLAPALGGLGAAGRPRRRPRRRPPSAAGRRQRARPRSRWSPGPAGPSVAELVAAGARAGPLVAVRRGAPRRRPGRARRGARGPGRRAGRGQPAGRARAGRGAARPAATSAGSTCAPARAARRRCSAALAAERGACAAGGRGGAAPRRPGAPGRPGRTPAVVVADGRGARRGRTGRFDRVLVDAPVHRAGRAAPPARGALAAPARRTCRRSPGCSATCSGGRWTRCGRAGWSPTSPARRTWPRPGRSSPTCCGRRDDVEPRGRPAAAARRARPRRRPGRPALAAPARHRRDVPRLLRRRS